MNDEAAALVRRATGLLKSLSTSEVARRSGLDRSTLIAWDKGVRNPTVDNLVAALNAVGYGLEIVPLGGAVRIDGRSFYDPGDLEEYLNAATSRSKMRVKVEALK